MRFLVRSYSLKCDDSAGMDGTLTLSFHCDVHMPKAEGSASYSAVSPHPVPSLENEETGSADHTLQVCLLGARSLKGRGLHRASSSIEIIVDDTESAEEAKSRIAKKPRVKLENTKRLYIVGDGKDPDLTNFAKSRRELQALRKPEKLKERARLVGVDEHSEGLVSKIMDEYQNVTFPGINPERVKTLTVKIWHKPYKTSNCHELYAEANIKLKQRKTSELVVKWREIRDKFRKAIFKLNAGDQKTPTVTFGILQPTAEESVSIVNEIKEELNTSEGGENGSTHREPSSVNADSAVKILQGAIQESRAIMKTQGKTAQSARMLTKLQHGLRCF